MHNPFKRTSMYKDHGSLRVFFLYLYYKPVVFWGGYVFFPPFFSFFNLMGVFTTLQLREERAQRSKTAQSEHWQVCVILEREKAGLWLCFYLLERLLLLMTCASPVEVNGALMSLPLPFVPG